MNPLFPILDAALADAATRSGAWLACRPGCHQCCTGVFAITALDVAALHEGLATADPATADSIRDRAQGSWARLAPNFPGNAQTGHLFTAPGHEEAFDDFANDEPCPVLDPTTGTCDLYAHRPVQCRTFGPPVRDEDDHLTVCELCFVDAPAEEVARCEMDQTWRSMEEREIYLATPLTGPSSRPEPQCSEGAVKRPAASSSSASGMQEDRLTIVVCAVLAAPQNLA